MRSASSAVSPLSKWLRLNLLTPLLHPPIPQPHRQIVATPQHDAEKWRHVQELAQDFQPIQAEMLRFVHYEQRPLAAQKEAEFSQ